MTFRMSLALGIFLIGNYVRKFGNNVRKVVSRTFICKSATAKINLASHTKLQI